MIVRKFHYFLLLMNNLLWKIIIQEGNMLGKKYANFKPLERGLLEAQYQH